MLGKNNVNILLVNDEPTLVQDMLITYGYTVQVALDGFNGLQILYNQIPDLLLLDTVMPRMDGWAMLKAIREGSECPYIPIIMLSDNDTEESLVTGLRHGADAYVVNPVSPRKLFAYIEALMRRAQYGSNGKINSQRDSSKNTLVGVLTRREREILEHIAQGFSNQDIGKKLIISETTVKNHLAHIYRKLKVSNRTQAAFMAQKLNLF